MTVKVHCDICDVVISTNRGGHVDSKPLHGLHNGDKPLDLCLPHYNDYRAVVHEWMKNYRLSELAHYDIGIDTTC